jgi:hypothetical protein
MHTTQRYPATPSGAVVGDARLEVEQIEKGNATMARTRTSKATEVAPHDVEVDLGNGFSTIYREGERIPPEHQGKPTKRASLPKGFTTQVDDEPKDDLAPNRIADNVIG